MKRNLPCFLIIILLIICYSHASAELKGEWITTEINEANVSLPIPENFFVLVRSMNKDDPLLATLDITSDEVDELLRSSTNYLYAEHIRQDIRFFFTYLPLCG